MRSCTGTASLVEVVNGWALTGLACDRLFGGMNVLLTKFRPAPVSNKLVMVRCLQVLMPTEIKTLYAGLWRNVESARQSLRVSQFQLFSISYFELALSAAAFCLDEGCSNDPFPSVFEVVANCNYRIPDGSGMVTGG